MTIYCRMLIAESNSARTAAVVKVGRGVPTAPLSLLTPSDGLSDGSCFCKSLQSRNLDRLTAKSPPGSPLSRPTCLTSLASPTQLSSVKPSQTESNPVKPPPLPPTAHPPPLTTPLSAAGYQRT